MVVSTANDRVLRSRRMLVELLLADHPIPCVKHKESRDCELELLAERLGVGTPRFARRRFTNGKDNSSLNIAVDHNACIMCDRCIRACTDVRHNDVIGRKGKGYFAAISFDNDLPMGESSCVNCGECLISCPTGALTNKGFTEARLDRGEVVSPESLAQLPIFEGISAPFLGRNQGAVVQREFKRGEIICREGDYGSTAFYILKGTVEVFLSTPMAHAKSQASGAGGLTRFLKKLTSLVGSQDDPRDQPPRRFIPIDAPVDLAYDNPVAQLKEGDLFGEMTCMSFYPRSATVQAAEDCIVLEMLRPILAILQKNKRFKAQMEKTYRQRALDTHLRSVPIFAGLTDEFLHHLRDRVELVRFEPGQVIFRQGEPADSFYLIRIGFVKVTQQFPGGEMVLAYLPRGSYFGEIGLLAPEGIRIATCTALDHVELVRISPEEFTLMLDTFPEIRSAISEVASGRQQQNRQQLNLLRSVPLDDFLDQGLMEAQNLLLIDLEKCTRCDACVRACADAHEGVTRLIREGLRYDKYLVATSCRQCRDPLCMVGCPVGSIRRKESLEIVIEDWCIGCGLCAKNCPYGNINMHPFQVMVEDPEQAGRTKAVVKEKATACDLSTHLKEPACVYACPHQAAIRVDPKQFFAERLAVTPISAPEGIRRP
jgi:CRP-like cAMP-binding protein/Fe-S oxidoreductase